MEFITRGKDLNFLALTDLEAMALSNLLGQYNELSAKTDSKGSNARRALSRKIDKAIKEGLDADQPA